MLRTAQKGNYVAQRSHSWPAAIVDALIAQGLAAHSYQAVGMLNKSSHLTPGTKREVIMSWAGLYRACREDGASPIEAAEQADDALFGPPPGGDDE